MVFVHPGLRGCANGIATIPGESSIGIAMKASLRTTNAVIGIAASRTVNAKFETSTA
jgi:hypothetical protein